MLMAGTLVLALAACGGAGTNEAVMNRSDGNVAAMPAVSPAVPAPAATDQAGGFAEFWPRFRQAALAGDAAALRSMSAPVVMAHGDLDDDPVKRLTPAEVPGAVAKVLAATDGMDAAGRTERAVLQAKAKLDATDLNGVGQQRIGDFVFKSDRAGRWRLTDLYTSDDG